MKLKQAKLPDGLWYFGLTIPSLREVLSLSFALRWNSGEAQLSGWAFVGKRITINWHYGPKREGQRFRIIATSGVPGISVPYVLENLGLGGEFDVPHHGRISRLPHREEGVAALGGPWNEFGFWYVGIHPDYLGPLAEGGQRSIAAGVAWEHK